MTDMNPKPSYSEWRARRSASSAERSLRFPQRRSARSRSPPRSSAPRSIRREIEHVTFRRGAAGRRRAESRRGRCSSKPGLAKTVTAETINKVCASGMLAVVNAMRSINAGANASSPPAAWSRCRTRRICCATRAAGYRFGDGALVDAMIYDGLWDQYFPMTMATQGSKVATELGLTREEQDRFALREPSPRRRSARSRHFADEIVPVRVATKAKDKVVVDALPRQGQRARSGRGRRAATASGSTSRRRSSRSIRSLRAVRHRRRAARRRRSRRSGPRRRQPRGDGEAAAARARTAR